MTIRALGAAEVETAVEWAAREGWNPGLADAAAFRAADPDGFLGAFRGEEMLACISAVRTGEGFGFIGFYIARPEARGQGIGWRVWQAGMARLAGRCVGLDGVVAQQENYRKSGFALAWNNARYQSEAPRIPEADTRGIEDAAAVLFEALLAFDAACFGLPRPEFLRGWIAAPGHRARVARDAAGAVTGFAVLRPCRAGAKLGPLFAVDAATARALVADAAPHRPPGPLILDLPEPHAEAVALAQAMGMEKVFETARMYTRPPPPMQREWIFGLTSFELG
ncbi:GNAT family N-acetyltransferase [Rubritepida flocculans]|uniref:GNAT family N-acetyltransferase n=1 Tax=Rubritepida flocculans TaxID=182403 RepID=UPI000425195C|nr:GNAT family N-acetyltransferase [Rubritepida flocculans]